MCASEPRRAERSHRCARGVFATVGFCLAISRALICQWLRSGGLLRITIVTWIETRCRRRLQTDLGRLTPIEFELSVNPPAAQAAYPHLSESVHQTRARKHAG